MSSSIFANEAASSRDIVSVGTAVERLCQAMLASDGATLKSLVDDNLSYGHSSGTLQDRDAFVDSLDGANSFKSLVLSNQTIKLAGDNAIVCHVFDSENNLPDGTTSSAHIGVMQVWKKHVDGWRLLARQAYRLTQS